MKMFRFALPAAAMITAAFVVSSHAQTARIASPASNGAQIRFEKDTHDFGTVKKGDRVRASFTFTNTGTSPLVISDAKGASGLITAEWPKQPFAPGAKGELFVKYDTSKGVGAVQKTIAIVTNAVNEPSKVLRVRGTVQ